ncbi:unnamed protein product [Rhizophagus irregularis]|nr:unnamed protein product [Rhizophagus irregularis]
MPQTRGRSNSRKDKSSPEQSKPKRGRGRGRNNTPQEEQFLTANSGRGRGRGRGQSNKKSHLLNEILEDSDYEDTIEPSLSGPFNLLPLNNTDLEELDSALAPRPESRSLNTSTPLREVQSNELENLSAPSRPERPASRSLNTSTPLREIQSNELENLSAPPRPERPASRSLNTSTPLREIQSNELENLSSPSRPERPASRSLNTSTPLREIQSNGLENLSSPSRPGLRDLNSPASLRSFNASASPTLPSCFNDMDTIFQLATWLCANPNVLQFANAIYSSMQTSLANGQQFTSSNLTNPTKLQLQSTLQEDKSKVSRDFLEELKCLFLRVRNPPKRALEELVQQIIKCDLNSAEGLEWLRIGNRQFGDFRNKFLDGIEKLVDSLKEKRKGQGIPETILPRKEDIADFVDEEITKNTLRRWLSAMKINDLRENSLIYLCNLVRKAVIINYNMRDPEKTKTLDIITKNLVIPSRNGSDFASNLEL